MKNLVLFIFLPVACFGQREVKTCENQKDLCLEMYLLKWRGSYTSKFNVIERTFPDMHYDNLDRSLLDSIRTRYDIKELFDPNVKKVLKSRLNYYDLKQHFNENQKIIFLDTSQLTKTTVIFRYIESILYDKNRMLIQYITPFDRTIEIIEFNEKLTGYRILGAVMRHYNQSVDNAKRYQYEYWKDD